MTGVSIDDYRWLVSPDAAAWLARTARALADNAGPAPELTVASQLRRYLPAERVGLLIEQIQLRRKAAAKFSAAAQIYFTALRLQQATDEWTAHYKACRFPAGAPALDLCCGLGGDLLALARRGSVIGIDRDVVSVVLAQANCDAVGLSPPAKLSTTTLLAGDVAELSLDPTTPWHIDPDRRPKGRRTTRVVAHEPGPEVIERLLRQSPAAAIKLAPAAELPEDWPRRTELEWISRQGECKQLVAWFGPLAHHPARRCATILGTDAAAPQTVIGTDAVECPIANSIGRYVCEPDAAVLAADLNDVLAGTHGLAALSSRGAYLTGDRLISDDALTCFEVLDVLPLNLKQIKAYLRERGIGRLEIKKRGVSIDPRQLSRSLRVPGDGSATILVTRVDGKSVATIARRVTN